MNTDPQHVARATYMRAWTARHLSYYQSYRDAHKAEKAERNRIYHAKYRARNALGNANRKFGETVLLDDWMAVWSGTCFGCGLSPAGGVDHIMPHSRGGRNVLDNLQPSCLPCNRHKFAKLPPVTT